MYTRKDCAAWYKLNCTGTGAWHIVHVRRLRLLKPRRVCHHPDHIPIRAVSHTHNTRDILLERPLTMGEMRATVS